MVLRVLPYVVAVMVVDGVLYLIYLPVINAVAALVIDVAV